MRNYNADIIEFANECEGKKGLPIDLDLSKCLKGSLSIATTGDVFEYYNRNTGKSHFALYIKRFSPLVLMQDNITKKWTVFEYSQSINDLKLKNVWINSLPKMLFRISNH